MHVRDLYAKHPTREKVWLYRGRNDGISGPLTGGKLNPADMESIIQAYAAVSGDGHLRCWPIPVKSNSSKLSTC